MPSPDAIVAEVRGRASARGRLTVAALAERDVVAAVPRGLWIGGEWRETGGSVPVEDPATGEVLAEVADATAEDAIAALDAAVAVQDEWAAHPPRERGEILRRAFEELMERQDELALLMTLEMGKPLAESRARSPTPPSSSAGSPRRPCGSRGATASRRRAPGG